MRRHLIPLLAAGGMMLAVGMTGLTPAGAHTPSSGATCDGVTAAGQSYEATDTNTLGVSIDGGPVTTKAFATSDSLTIAVPQDGETHEWTAYVHTSNTNPSYSHDYSGKVGPCGAPNPGPTTKPIDEDRSTCTTGVEHRDGTVTTPSVFVDGAWIPGTPEAPVWGAWVHVRDLTNAEKVKLGCDRPTKPEPKVSTAKHHEESCKIGGSNDSTSTTTISPVFDDATFSWVDGEPVTTTTPVVFTPYTTAELLALGCVKPPKHHEPPHTVVVHHKTPPPPPAGLLPNTGGVPAVFPIVGLGLAAAGALALAATRRARRQT